MKKRADEREEGIEMRQESGNATVVAPPMDQL